MTYYPEPYPGLTAWLLSGETGLSSEAIVGYLTGLHRRGRYWTPVDPGDFRRCERLLRAVPTLRAEFHRMRDVSSEWAYLVDNWQTIVDTMEAEAPGCFAAGRVGGRAPRAHKLIQAARHHEETA